MLKSVCVFVWLSSGCGGTREECVCVREREC